MPITFGLILPSAGFSSESLLVSTNAVDGPVLPTSVLSSAGVGSFSASQVVIDPPRVGAVVAVNLSFTATMPIAAGSTVTFRLPMLQLGGAGLREARNATVVSPVSSPPGLFAGVLWYQDETELVAEVLVDIQNSTSVTLILSRAAGLYLITAGKPSTPHPKP